VGVRDCVVQGLDLTFDLIVAHFVSGLFLYWKISSNLGILRLYYVTLQTFLLYVQNNGRRMSIEVIGPWCTNNRYRSGKFSVAIFTLVMLDTFFAKDQQIRNYDVIIDCFFLDFTFYVLDKYLKWQQLTFSFTIYVLAATFILYIPQNSNNVRNGLWSQNLSIFFYFELHIFATKVGYLLF